MGLREKYAYGIQTAKDLHIQGLAEELDGKLHFKGTVGTQAEANKDPEGPAGRALRRGYRAERGSCTYSAVTTVEMPPRTEKSPTTVILRGRHAATRSSRI